jgi:hypothetical protein
MNRRTAGVMGRTMTSIHRIKSGGSVVRSVGIEGRSGVQ